MARDAAGDSGSICFHLNGRPVIADCADTHTTLLDYVRSVGLTGAKEGCAEGECGACTVVFVAEHERGSRYQPVNSCLLFLPAVAGREVYTVEALAASGPLHPVQQAMAAAGGSQCGYCTPGFVMSLFAEHYRPGRTSACDPHALSGNLCRCTGYRPIRDAALALAPAADDAFRRRLARPAPQLRQVEVNGGGRFSRPAKLDDCLAVLAADPQARLLAGGTDLAVESNLLGRRFSHLVSLEAIPEIRTFRDGEDSVEIGAGLTLDEIETCWQSAPAVFHEWLELFASPLIRNRATLGGNLATASPIGDAAPLLLALDARVRIAAANGMRTVPLDRFFLGYRRTALGTGEILVSITIPKPVPRNIGFFKAAKRKADDISTVAAAFAISLDGGGRVRTARLAYGGVAPTPVRAAEAEAALLGQAWNLAGVRQAQAKLRATLAPISDHRGSAAYRLALAQSLLEKFLAGTAREAAA